MKNNKESKKPTKIVVLDYANGRVIFLEKPAENLNTVEEFLESQGFDFDNICYMSGEAIEVII